MNTPIIFLIGYFLGAAMGGADAGKQAYDQLLEMPEELWEGHPEYGTKTKEEIALGLARNNGIMTAAVSVGLSKLIPSSMFIEKKHL